MPELSCNPKPVTARRKIAAEIRSWRAARDLESPLRSQKVRRRREELSRLILQSRSRRTSSSVPRLNPTKPSPPQDSREKIASLRLIVDHSRISRRALSLAIDHGADSPSGRCDSKGRARRFHEPVRVNSRDEMALLATSFNKMTVDLRSSRAEIEEYSRTLEKKVADRTAKLEAQNVAIRETQEALVRTTRLASVGEVAGRAAHEVLNPLTNIMARLEKIRLQGRATGQPGFEAASGNRPGLDQVLQ